MTKRKAFMNLSEVDASGSADRYARLLARLDDSMQAHKNRSYDLLQLRPGQRVLDIGAGTGDDVLALARLVNPGGRVVAIDKSRDLLRRARRRAGDSGLDVEFLQGDAHALDLPSASFDACRAERVFQHLENPETALAELVRVMRPGGRVLILDADYGTLAIDASDRDVTQAIVRQRVEAAPNGWIGRQLSRLLREAGLEVLLVEGISFSCTDHDLAFEIFELDIAAEQSVAAGEVTRQRVDVWRAELAERGRIGHFFLASTGFMVLGRKGRDEPQRVSPPA